MHRMTIRSVCFIDLLFVGIAQAQVRFSIRAASAQPVEGWQRMQLEHIGTAIWVSPSAAVVSSDIESAQPEVRAAGDRVIRVIFTEAGANKIRHLTTAQLKKHVALVVDDKLIWAPIVQAVAGKESVLTGTLPNGLSEDQVQRIMASLQYRLAF